MKTVRKYTANKWCTCKHALTLFLVLVLSGTANAQNTKDNSSSLFQIAYERALLDSLIRYERLKPAFIATKLAYDHQNKAYQALQGEYRLYRVQSERQVQAMQAESKAAGRKRFWRGFWTGAATGISILIIIL